MARGWESKSVEAQQADRAASGPKPPPLNPDEAARAAGRRTIELALSRARADLAAASRPAHRAMLETAIRTLEDQLR